MDENLSTFWNRIPRRKRSNLNLRTIKRPWTSLPNIFIASSEPSLPPEWLVHAMEKHNGDNAVLVLEEKKLSKTDLDVAQGRLLIPSNHQILSAFLNDEEIETLEKSLHDKKKEGIKVVFLGLDKEPYALELRKWVKSLVLTKGWIKVLSKGMFAIGNKYPLWSFRSEDQGLYFALVPNQYATVGIEVQKEESACLFDMEIDESFFNNTNTGTLSQLQFDNFNDFGSYFDETVEATYPFFNDFDDDFDDLEEDA